MVLSSCFKDYCCDICEEKNNLCVNVGKSIQEAGVKCLEALAAIKNFGGDENQIWDQDDDRYAAL